MTASTLNPNRIVIAVLARMRSERGAGLLEYSMLIALIAVVCVAGVTALGSATEAPFSSAQSGFAP